ASFDRPSSKNGPICSRGKEASSRTTGSFLAIGIRLLCIATRPRRAAKPVVHRLPTVPPAPTEGLPNYQGDLRSVAVARPGDRATTRDTAVAHSAGITFLTSYSHLSETGG